MKKNVLKLIVIGISLASILIILIQFPQGKKAINQAISPLYKATYIADLNSITHLNKELTQTKLEAIEKLSVKDNSIEEMTLIIEGQNNPITTLQSNTKNTNPIECIKPTHCTQIFYTEKENLFFIKQDIRRFLRESDNLELTSEKKVVTHTLHLSKNKQNLIELLNQRLVLLDKYEQSPTLQESISIQVELEINEKNINQIEKIIDNHQKTQGQLKIKLHTIYSPNKELPQIEKTIQEIEKIGIFNDFQPPEDIEPRGYFINPFDFAYIYEGKRYDKFYTILTDDPEQVGKEITNQLQINQIESKDYCLRKICNIKLSFHKSKSEKIHTTIQNIIEKYENMPGGYAPISTAQSKENLKKIILNKLDVRKRIIQEFEISQDMKTTEEKLKNNKKQIEDTQKSLQDLIEKEENPTLTLEIRKPRYVNIDGEKIAY